VLPVGSEICVRYTVARNTYSVKNMKTILCYPQRPTFRPKPIPEQDKVVSKRVEIIEISACNIILLFSHEQNWWF